MYCFVFIRKGGFCLISELYRLCAIVGYFVYIGKIYLLASLSNMVLRIICFLIP